MGPFYVFKLLGQISDVAPQLVDDRANAERPD